MKNFAKTLLVLLLVTSVSHLYAAIQDRHITGFNAINASGSFNVYITQGQAESVKVDAPDKIIDQIKTEVVDGELRIFNKSNQGWSMNWFGGNHQKVVIYITARQLQSVVQSGSGDTFFKNGIKAPSLKIRVSGSGSITGLVDAKDLESTVTGSGDMKLSGHVINAAVKVTGSGEYAARELAASNVAIHVSGSGGASVNVSDRLDASVSGSGDIRYTGSAKNVSSSKSGSGSISRN